MLKHLKKIILIGLFSVIGIFLGSWFYLSIEDFGIWSVSIYQGTSIFDLIPHTKIRKHPILSAANVTDMKAVLLADPFLIMHDNHWFLFFEVKGKYSPGVIGLASSVDGIVWNYEKIVLQENFHLSYPYVFQWGNTFYMLPESSEANAMRLYTAVEFPYQWKYEHEIMKGRFFDSSIFFKNGKFWIFTFDESNRLRLFFADSLTGPWMEHPKSPLIKNDLNITRPGGRLLVLDDKLIRFAQDGYPYYGNSVRAFQIDLLSTSDYKEHEVSNSPLLTGSGSGWNKDGMHHVDPHKIDENSWVASVDGKEYIKDFNVIKGFRKLKSTIKSLWRASFNNSASDGRSLP